MRLRPSSLGRLLVVAGLVGVGLVAGGCGEAPERAPDEAFLSLVETLGGADTVGYQRADAARDFVFPTDHGPHPGYRTEWWYVTGNLSTAPGVSGPSRDFGFHFTVFRNALAPTAPGGPSAWATNQAYMGHFAVTDITGGAFRAEERFARGAAGLAGAEGGPLRVWIEDWVLEAASSGAEAGGVFPLRLSADGEAMGVNLVLERGKPHVLQGDAGLSRKGPEVGNASYYYAHTRMPTSGRLAFEGDTLEVSGLAWLDREWSTSALSPGQVGWDWFALQLDDGWEMMVYQLRRADGSADPLSDGVLIDPEGRRLPLEWGSEVVVESTGRWRSPVDGAEYPSGWRIRVPSEGWDLTVEPAVADQELRVAFRYWEGAVRVSGVGADGDTVTGRGYVELTGYAEAGS